MISCLTRKGSHLNSISSDELRQKVMDKYDLKLSQVKKLNKEKLCKMFYTELYKESLEKSDVDNSTYFKSLDSFKDSKSKKIQLDFTKNYNVDQLRNLLKHSQNINKLKTKSELIDRFIETFYIKSSVYNPILKSIKKEKEDIMIEKKVNRDAIQDIVSSIPITQKEIIIDNIDKLNINEDSFLKQINDLESKMNMITDKITSSFNIQINTQINKLLHTLFVHLDNKDKKYQDIMKTINNQSNVFSILKALQFIKQKYSSIIENIINELKINMDKITNVDINDSIINKNLHQACKHYNSNFTTT